MTHFADTPRRVAAEKGMEERTRIGIIGHGKMALDCGKFVLQRDNAALAVVISTDPSPRGDARLRAFCEAQQVGLIESADPNSPEAVQALERAAADYIFSINNYKILKAGALSAARSATLNFHNGPLPSYAGMHIPTWALWNGEPRHGVTWHYVDAGIDTGDIACQALFDVGASETAGSLMFRCIMEGIRLFPVLLDDLLRGNAARRRQAGPRSYYGRDDVPNGGFIEPSWDAETLSRFLRAMEFRPFPNPCGPIKLRAGSGTACFRAGTAAPSAENAALAAGTVVAVDAQSVRLRCAESDLTLLDPVSEAGSFDVLCRELGIYAGAVLPCDYTSTVPAPCE